MKKTDMIRKKLLQNQDINEAVVRVKNDAEFREVARELVRGAEINAEPGNAVDPFSPYYANPQFEAAMRAALAKALREHKHRADIVQPNTSPSKAMLPTLLAGRLSADINVYLNEGTTPNGQIVVGPERFALKFRSYEVALNNQYSKSTREWREWLHKEVGEACWRNEVSAVDDYNARACFSSLHAPDDKHGNNSAVVGNIILRAVWDGHNLIELNVIREKTTMPATVRAHTGGWAGFKAKL